MTASDRKTLRAITDWTGHTTPPQPTNPKLIGGVILLLFLTLFLHALLK